MENLRGYQLSEKLREVAEETENPIRAGIMVRAAEEIEALITEIRDTQRKVRDMQRAIRENARTDELD